MALKVVYGRPLPVLDMVLIGPGQGIVEGLQTHYHVP